MTRKRMVRERKRINRDDRETRAIVGAFPNRPARRSLARFYFRQVNDATIAMAKMYFVTDAP